MSPRSFPTYIRTLRSKARPCSGCGRRIPALVLVTREETFDAQRPHILFCRHCSWLIGRAGATLQPDIIDERDSSHGIDEQRD
jgi:hypothetical protein